MLWNLIVHYDRIKTTTPLQAKKKKMFSSIKYSSHPTERIHFWQPFFAQGYKSSKRATNWTIYFSTLRLLSSESVSTAPAFIHLFILSLLVT